MSFGRGHRGGRGRGGRFGGRSGGRYNSTDPPDYVIEVGTFEHPCEGEAVCKLTIEKIPYFNAPIFKQNKIQIGKVEEIFGLMRSPFFTIKLNEGIVATSYSNGEKFYIDPNRLLPLERFLPSSNAKQPRSTPGRGRGRGGGGRRGGFTPRGRGGRFRGGRRN
eukprot:g313.t1